MPDNGAEIDKYGKEVAKIEQQLTRLAERKQKLQKAGHAAIMKLQRAELKALIGKKVIYAYRRPERDPKSWMNDAEGILLDVRRTRCTVDHGERGRWTFAIERIIAASEKQGVSWFV
jgi:hypothetical protein